MADDSLGRNYLDTTHYELKIDYKLSNEQIEISTKVLEGFKNKKNTLIYAVCGAGKTELVFKVIEYSIKKHLKVGFAIPRKDVVVELKERLAKTFKEFKVIALYGGHHDELYADIIVLTTHQLFRYDKYFDLLILDEIDAFPYKDNPVLINIFKRSLKGNFIMMSATPSDKTISEFKNDNNCQFLTLFHRYHHHPLPVPKIKILYSLFKYTYLIDKLTSFLRNEKPVLVFVPTIRMCDSLYKMISIFLKNGSYVHSKRNERNEIIQLFRQGKFKYLITTSVLERGVTLKDLQVIIFNSDHDLYTKEALIQISGRVGRVKDCPKGEIIYVANKKSKSMVESIKTIEKYNKDL